MIYIIGSYCFYDLVLSQVFFFQNGHESWWTKNMIRRWNGLHSFCFSREIVISKKHTSNETLGGIIAIAILGVDRQEPQQTRWLKITPLATWEVSARKSKTCLVDILWWYGSFLSHGVMGGPRKIIHSIAGFSFINQPFWGMPHLWNPHFYVCLSLGICWIH